MNLKEVIANNNIPFNFSAARGEDSATMATIELPDCTVKSADDEWEVFGMSIPIAKPYNMANHQAILAEALHELNVFAETEGINCVSFNGQDFPVNQAA